MKQVDCRYFSGYKPCGESEECTSKCASLNIPNGRLLIVHLEALGAVLRSTALLPAILEKYPNAHITWVTKTPANQVLKNNPLIDRVLTTDNTGLLTLKALHFDTVFCLDKSLEASGVLKSTSYDEVIGFKASEKNGAILPTNKEAVELWNLGLNNDLKFHVNKKSEIKLSLEALNLPTNVKLDYVLELTEGEKQSSTELRKNWVGEAQNVIGINTGCAETLPYKKLSESKIEELINKLSKIKDSKIVLLGGPEDAKRNLILSKKFKNIINSETEKGIRDGICSMEACDIVISGDSFGMHMAIALKKWVVAWFGPTCDHEIELYGRGEKVKSNLDCSPCWNRNCNVSNKCNNQVDISELLKSVNKGLQWQKNNSSYKQHLSEMSF